MSAIFPLTGGIHPAENKTRSTQQPILKSPLPKQLLLPLEGQFGAPPQPVVEVGDNVLKGQLLARPDSPFGTRIHAPTSGTISAIEQHPLAHPSGMTGTTIVLTPDGQDQWIERIPCADFSALATDQLVAKIADAGIAGLGGAGFPTHIKLGGKSIDTLIINAVECEPYITADDALMREKSAEIIAGIRILQQALANPERTLIGIEDNKPEAIAALQAALAADNYGIEVVVIPTKYPSGGEKQLIQILTGKEVPSGGLPAHLGIVCQNIGTAQAVKRAVVDGEPLVSRITTVTGDACQQNGNMDVLLGTPVEFLLQQFGYQPSIARKVLMGGPMMGFALHSLRAPVVKTTNCLLALGLEEAPEPAPEQPCIRCGHCAEVCPASLLPQQLLWYAKSQNHDRLLAHDLMDCIECGACAYVCPSNIPLVQYYRAAKGEIRIEREDKAKSAVSRERFEFRKVRLEQQAADKEAKRAERRAAAQAKSDADSNSEHSSATGADDLIKAAMARVAAKKADPAEEVAKYERHLNSAQSRLKFAEEKRAEAATDAAADIEKLDAQVAAAKLKLQETEQKLAQAKVQLASGAATAAAPEKATLNASTEDRAKLVAGIASIENRIATTEAKIAEAEDESLKSALQTGLGKLQTKLADQQALLAQLDASPATTAERVAESTDAASAAIARAQARAAQRDTMSADQKRAADIQSLESRLAKARDKATEAKQSGSEHAEALQAAAEKLQAKLDALLAQTDTGTADADAVREEQQ